MNTRLLLLVLGLAALAFGCDSGPGSESSSAPGSSVPRPAEDREREPALAVDDFLPEVVEMCRGAYGRLPAEERAATTEDAFIEQCLAAVSGRPDPVRGAPS